MVWSKSSYRAQNNAARPEVLEDGGMSLVAKVCTGVLCKGLVDKPIAEFAEATHMPDGRAKICNACVAEQIRLDKQAGVGPHVSPEKECSKCHKVKPRSEFSRLAAASDGLNPQCTDCKTANQRAASENRRTRPVNAPTKKCMTCRKEKPKDKFLKDGRTRDGVSVECTDCLAALDPSGVARLPHKLTPTIKLGKAINTGGSNNHISRCIEDIERRAKDHELQAAGLRDAVVSLREIFAKELSK